MSRADSATEHGGIATAPARTEAPVPPSRRGVRKLVTLAVAAALFAALYAYPFTGVNDSVILTMSTIFMWIILSTSWNLISGFAGYVDSGSSMT